MAFTLDTITNEIDRTIDTINQVADAQLEWITGGAVGVNRDTGQLGPGTATQGGIKALSWLTGRDIKEQALQDQRAALAEERRQQELNRTNEQERKRQLDIQASQAAGLLTQAQNAAQRKSLGMSDSNIERDFLGLS